MLFNEPSLILDHRIAGSDLAVGMPRRFVLSLQTVNCGPKAIRWGLIMYMAAV